MASVSAVNITIHKVTSFEESFTLTGEDGIPLNLVNSTVTAKLRKYPGADTAFNFSAEVTIATGTIKLKMTPEVTSTLPTGRAYYDILVTNNTSNLVTKVVNGNVLVEETASL